MRFGAVAENPLERLIVRLNLAPQPLLETQMAYTLARLIMVGTKLGVFEAVSDGAATPNEVAARCGTSQVGTEKLLFCARRRRLLLQFLECDWMERAEDYVRTGEPLELHSTDLPAEDWGLYQRGMRAMASAARTATTRSRSAAATKDCARRCSICPRRWSKQLRCWRPRAWATAWSTAPVMRSRGTSAPTRMTSS